MNPSNAISRGLFGQTDDGRLLFFTVPRSRTAFVVPDAIRAEALRVTSKYWGAFEVATAIVVAPLALRFGVPGLLIAFVIFALGSVAAYQYAVRQWVVGLDRIAVSHGAYPQPLAGAIDGLRTISEEAHSAMLWFYQLAAVLPFAGSILMVMNAHSARNLIGGLLAMAFFGAGGLAASFMLAYKHSPTVKAAAEEEAASRRAAI